MRHVLYGLVCGVIAILVLMAVLTVDSIHTRQRELDQAVAQTCKEVMQNTYDTREYLYVTQESFLSEFRERLQDKICLGGKKKDPNLALHVDVAALDLDNGLFSVKVTEYFTYPNGIRGKVISQKTAIYEESLYAV